MLVLRRERAPKKRNFLVQILPVEQGIWLKQGLFGALAISEVNLVNLIKKDKLFLSHP